ncbi:MAG: hypothetical protein FWH00_00600 [Oscillospiraceae bacterium]|nr:hypothetical protein [Oscillospiraceae bacterium]
MRKYLLRYLIFWLPALLAALLLRGNRSMLAEAVQFFCGFFMLFGFAVNSGMAARAYPRSTLTAIMLYFGAGTLLMSLVYTGRLQSLFGEYSRTIAGIFSYVPLGVFLRKMLDFNIMHEVYIISGISIFMFIGWAMGLLYVHHNPNPKSPRISR